MESIEPILSILANAKAIVGIGGMVGVGQILGFIPRVGLVRAIKLKYHSKLFGVSRPKSVRTSEMNELSNTINTLDKGQYITVIGGKGNGKSCLIDTALEHTPGVVNTSVSKILDDSRVLQLISLYCKQTQSGADKDDITASVHKLITGTYSLAFIDLSKSTRRVLFWYNLISKKAPIVVIRVPERVGNANYADTPSAVRCLADEFGLRVVVDGSPNSLPPELLRTNREIIINVEPMSRTLLEGIPEFREFVDFLKKHNLDDAVWKVVGGCPAKFMQIKNAFSKVFSERIPEKVEAVKVAISNILIKAKGTISNGSPNTEAIVRLWMEKKWEKVSIDELKGEGFRLDIPNKVFRVVTEGKAEFVVPANPATGLILSSGLAFDVNAVPKVENILFQSMPSSN